MIWEFDFISAIVGYAFGAWSILLLVLFFHGANRDD